MTGALADATGRTDEELRFALTVAAAGVVVLAVLRLLDRLQNLGFTVIRHSRKRT